VTFEGLGTSSSSATAICAAEKRGPQIEGADASRSAIGEQRAAMRPDSIGSAECRNGRLGWT
jgi:hypothetical protein